MPTTVQKTIKAAGGDYVSLAALEAENANLVALDEVWVVTADNLQETATVTFAGWTTDATRYLHVRAADPHGSTGRVTTSSFRLVVNAACLAVTSIGSGGFMIFEGIQFKCTNAASLAIDFNNNGGIAAKVRFDSCVIESLGLGLNMQGGAANTNDAEFINCLWICALSCVVRQFRDIWIYSNTCITLTAGQHCLNFGANDGRTKIVKSTYARGNGGGGNDYNSVYTGTQALSSDTTGTVDNIAYDTSNFTNVTAGTEDLRLVTGSDLLAAGADRSAELAPFNYVVDIRDFPRALVGDDAGAFEDVAPPVAAFTGTPLTGTEPLDVTFTDQSTGSPTSWLWDFGDGDTSVSQNPVHTFEAGVWTVSLTATSIVGSDEEEKIAYVTVEASSSEDDDLCSTDDFRRPRR